MNPGRELDALIAEKVMGWTNLGERWSDTNLSGYRWQKPSGERLTEEGFQPSTNVAAAWTVVERLSRDFEYVRLLTTEDGASVKMPLTNGRAVEIMANTVPLAICLAALAAVGQHTSPDRLDLAENAQ